MVYLEIKDRMFLLNKLKKVNSRTNLILRHLELPVPRVPAGRHVELKRVNPLLHLLQPFTQKPNFKLNVLTENIRVEYFKYMLIVECFIHSYLGCYFLIKQMYSIKIKSNLSLVI